MFALPRTRAAGARCTEVRLCAVSVAKLPTAHKRASLSAHAGYCFLQSKCFVKNCTTKRYVNTAVATLRHSLPVERLGLVPQPLEHGDGLGAHLHQYNAYEMIPFRGRSPSSFRRKTLRRRTIGVVQPTQLSRSSGGTVVDEACDNATRHGIGAAGHGQALHNLPVEIAVQRDADAAVRTLDQSL